MYVFAFALLLLVLLAALGGGGLALLQLWQGRDDCLRLFVGRIGNSQDCLRILVLSFGQIEYRTAQPQTENHLGDSLDNL